MVDTYPAPRWIYHLVLRSQVPVGDLTPASLETEGFVHGSFRSEVRESARLYFPRGADVVAIPIDPRRAAVPIERAKTPRGPMPHLFGSIPRDALGAPVELAAIDEAPDLVTGTRFGFVAFGGVTLLDLVGVLDPVSRLASMGFDATTTCEVIAADTPDVWAHHGASFAVARVRPALDAFDVLVVAGGLGTRALERDAAVLAWLATFPRNRVLASVCTGSLLLAAAGLLAGRRATTHVRELEHLRGLGALAEEARLVDAWPLVTAGGVTCALDLGLHLVRRLAGDEVARAIAAQMQLPSGAMGTLADR